MQSEQSRGPAMPIDWTPAVSRAIEVARAWASAAQAEEVFPLHLLHGLLAEEEGRAAQLAGASGLDWQAYRRETTIPPLGESGEALPLSEAVRQILRSASEIAVELAGDRTIAGDSLLLALAR